MKIDEYRIATNADVPALVELINSSYRPTGGVAGWTHESDLIGGDRVNGEQLTGLLMNPGSTMLLGLSDREIVACVNVNEEAGAVFIAMLTVRPNFQNTGFGKEMLQLAEEYADNQYEVSECNLFVIQARTELYEFYLRRGYLSAGITSDYPANAGVGIPKVEGLKLELLTKKLSV